MRRSLLSAALLAAAPAWAQDAPQTVVITGNPLRSNQVAAPSTVLSGDALTLRRGSTLGDTLDGMPGVSSSWFGPNANRPVIRGQDADRIRVLSNAGASLDASSLSFDHAVPIDPLVVERIEVLRGPAALLYGGSAVGGVINAIDNRIPRARIDTTSSRAEVRFGGAARERGASGVVETGGAGFALHADAFRRKTDDLRVPRFEHANDDGTTERRTRVANSASDVFGGALGASLVSARGHLGASVEAYRNDYGVVAEDHVTIRMRRDRIVLAGEQREMSGFFATLRGQAAATDYRHEEVEGHGEIGTTFKNRGADARFEAVHRALALGAGRVEGVIGLQGESSRFAALGEEAFVPTTHTRQLAAFWLEQWSFSERGQLSAGLRAERVRVDSDGDTPGEEPRFGLPQRHRFAPRSASLGAVLPVAAAWQVQTNWAYTERTPSSYELYANGVHAATGTFERGDAQQSKERGRNVDVALEWNRAADRIRIGAFASHFPNYIALVATGEPDFVDDEGEAFPVFAFRGVRARLRGVEAEATWRLTEGARTIDLDGNVALVRGDDSSSGEPLPRVAPLRATLALNLMQGAWAARAEVQHAARQTRVPSDDSATPAWTVVNLWASYRTAWGARDALWFVKLQNVGDRLAYNAATIATVRARSPLPGRSMMLGVRAGF